MGKGRIRDYADVMRRLRVLPAKHWRVTQIRRVWGYPFFAVVRQPNRQWPTVFLTGGMHGEEPAGVEGVLQWLESPAALQWRVNWFVLPCINPYGWERNQRRNKQRYDINRQFRSPTDCVEAQLIKRLIRHRRFRFVMEFHEDVDATGFYLYEVTRLSPEIGEKMVAAVGKVVPINRERVIDSRPANGRGLIQRPKELTALQKRKRWPMAYHLFLHHTDHVLGSETAIQPPLAQRARAHTTALRTALRSLT